MTKCFLSVWSRCGWKEWTRLERDGWKTYGWVAEEMSANGKTCEGSDGVLAAANN